MLAPIPGSGRSGGRVTLGFVTSVRRENQPGLVSEQPVPAPIAKAKETARHPRPGRRCGRQVSAELAGADELTKQGQPASQSPPGTGLFILPF